MKCIYFVSYSRWELWHLLCSPTSANISSVCTSEADTAWDCCNTASTRSTVETCICHPQATGCCSCHSCALPPDESVGVMNATTAAPTCSCHPCALPPDECLGVMHAAAATPTSYCCRYALLHDKIMGEWQAADIAMEVGYWSLATRRGSVGDAYACNSSTEVRRDSSLPCMTCI